MKHGFTLIEILVTVSIIAVVSVLISQTFLTTLRSNTKTDVSRLVKQEGEYAVSAIEQLVRNAKAISTSSSDTVCDGTDAAEVYVTSPNEGVTTFKCLDDSGVARIASVSASATKYLTGKNVTMGSACSTADALFKCTTAGDSPAQVTVSFTLSQKGIAQDQIQKASIPFQTTILVRNSNL